MPQVAVVFTKPRGAYDRLVSSIAGNLVHVDLMPIDTQNCEQSMVFTNYMGETFSMNLCGKRLYNNQRHVALLLETDDNEQELLYSYLHDLCEQNIPYNYTDLAFEFIPRSISCEVVNDVVSENPKEITKLFCSQAIVLALRNSLNHSKGVCRTLRKLNSRLTLPIDLFHALRPFTRYVCCNALSVGRVVPYSVMDVF